MKTMRLLILFLTYLFCTFAAWAQQDPNAPELLTYEEIVQLYQQDVPPAALRDKLKQLLTTPFVSNRAFRSGVRPLKPASLQIGKFLRVAEWNIERGLEFDVVKSAFTKPQQFAELMDQKKSTASPEERSRILRMNYAYGVEFVEVDPITMGIDQQVVMREVKETYGEPAQNKTEMLDQCQAGNDAG